MRRRNTTSAPTRTCAASPHTCAPVTVAPRSSMEVIASAHKVSVAPDTDWRAAGVSRAQAAAPSPLSTARTNEVAAAETTLRRGLEEQPASAVTARTATRMRNCTSPTLSSDNAIDSALMATSNHAAASTTSKRSCGPDSDDSLSWSLLVSYPSIANRKHLMDHPRCVRIPKS
jgi:hypothetical protein